MCWDTDFTRLQFSLLMGGFKEMGGVACWSAPLIRAFVAASTECKGDVLQASIL